MNLRALLFVSALLPAGASYAQDACVATDPTSCTDANTIQFCNAENVTETFDCTQIGATCGEVGCNGPSADCADGVLLFDCVAPVGGQCLGAAPLLNEDATDDDSAFTFRCAGDATCLTGPNAAGDQLIDTCVAHVGPACTVDTEAECAGDSLVFCRRFIENAGDTEATIAQDSNVGLDCAALGGTCNPAATASDGTVGPDCEFPDAPAEGEGEGSTTEGEGEDEGNDGGNEGEGERDGPPEDPPGGGCVAAGMVPVGGTLALALLALRRRRRA